MLALLLVLAPLPAAAPAEGSQAAAPSAVQEAAAPAGAEAEFLRRYAELEELIRRRRWARAYDGLRELLAAHEGAAYALERVGSIEADVKRCAFWMAHEEPALEDLLDARLERWDAHRGSLRLTFDAEHLGDLRVHAANEDPIYELEAVWSGPWTAAFAGPAATLERSQLYVFLDDGTIYGVALGHRSAGEQSFFGHAITRQVADEIEVLERAEPEERPDDERVTAQVTVTATRIKLEVGRRRVFDVRRDDRGGLGTVGFSFVADPDGGPGLGELTVAGEVDPGWADGLVDAAVQEARDAFDAAWDPGAHLPPWLADAARPAGADDLPELGPFPVPETFDLVAADHPRTVEHVERVEAWLAGGRYADALRYLAGLPADDVEPNVRDFLACVTLMVADRPREAFAVGERLWREQPGSLTAGYLEAVLHAELKREDVALARFRRLTEDHPAAWEPWYGLTSLLLLQRRSPEALDALAAGRASASDTAQLWRLEDRLALLSKGPPWDRVFEADALHYRIRSDTDARTTRAVAQEVASAWRTYERVLGRVEVPEEETVPLFLFSGAATYRAYAQHALASDIQHTAGVFSRELQVVLVWNTPSQEDLLATIRHEVLHQYLDARMGALPPWFNEGLAEYYEIAEVVRGLPALGETHPAHAQALRDVHAVPDLRSLVHAAPEAFYATPQASYPLAWAFVHFLRHTTLERRQRFDALWDRLDRREDAVGAIEGAFEGVDWAAWNEAFLDHLVTLAGGPR